MPCSTRRVWPLRTLARTGKWRDLDESGSKVDASGSMPDGTKFEDLNAFRAVLVKDPESLCDDRHEEAHDVRARPWS